MENYNMETGSVSGMETFDHMPNLPEYKGERDAVTLSTWIDYLNRYARMFGWSDQKKLNAAVLFLKDSAYRWLMTFEKSFKEDRPMTWNDFVEGLNSYFKPIYTGRQYRHMLHECRQESTVAEYIDRFYNIIMNIPGITEDKKLDHFCRGLLPNIRVYVNAYVPTSMLEAQRLALAKEDTVVSIKYRPYYY